MTWPTFARGRVRGPKKGMNKTEAAYNDTLRLRMLAGEIAWYKYEGVTLKLADDTRITFDFLVMLPDGRLEFHEVKGHMEDDAWVKCKVAAEQFPIPIKLVGKKYGGEYV